MNKNQNGCNKTDKCSKCQKDFWLGFLNQMENFPEGGIFCNDCLDEQAEKKCRRCSKLFIKREFTEQEQKENKEWDALLMKDYGKRSKGGNSFGFCHGSAPCHIKVNPECHGHRIRQHGLFCSTECHDDWYKNITKDGKKYKEWKIEAEKLGWHPCQEKDIYSRFFRDFPELLKGVLERVKGRGETTACWGLAYPGENYCENCKEERGEGKKVKEKSWQEAYRKYWNLTDENTYLSNSNNNSKINLVGSNSGSVESKRVIEKQLIKAVNNNFSKEEMERLKSELKNLSNQTQENNKISPKNNNILIWSIITSVSILFLGIVILFNKNKKKY